MRRQVVVTDGHRAAVDRPWVQPPTPFTMVRDWSRCAAGPVDAEVFRARFLLLRRPDRVAVTRGCASSRHGLIARPGSLPAGPARKIVNTLIVTCGLAHRRAALNGRIEGTNNLLQVLRRSAHGTPRDMMHPTGPKTHVSAKPRSWPPSITVTEISATSAVADSIGPEVLDAATITTAPTPTAAATASASSPQRSSRCRRR